MIAGGVLLAAAAFTAYIQSRRPPALPATDSSAYQQIVRAFYRGLAALDTGLLDNAQAEFTSATTLVPGEPASWANLGIVHLRRAEFDPAARAIEEAARLAPQSSRIAMLHGALDITRGRPDAAIVALRRAVELDPRSVRARFALAEALEQARGDNAIADAGQQLDQILAIQPGNLAVLVDRARIRARLGDARGLDGAVREMTERSSGWPPAALEQLEALRAAVQSGDGQATGRAIAFLRNVLARVPAYRDSLAAVRVPAELFAEPFDRFLVLQPPTATPAPPDMAIAFSREPLSMQNTGPARAIVAWPMDETGAPAVFATDGDTVRRPGESAAGWPFPAGASPPGAASLLPLDWNHDFRSDLLLAGGGGVRLLVQNSDGTLSDRTPISATDRTAETPCFGAWTADLDMDGDLDLVLGTLTGAPVIQRNNGDGTWRTLRPFDEVMALRGFAWGDIDRDGDPDAVLLDASGALHVFANQQAGAFERRPVPPTDGPIVAVALGDPNADGVIDILTLDASGALRRASSNGSSWDRQTLAMQGLLPGAVAGAYRIMLGDLDNNGGLDLAVSGPSGARIWLSDEAGALQALPAIADVDVFGLIDLNGDGRLDLVGLAGGQPVRMRSSGQRSYHWQVIRPRAQTTAGDQRINAFGVGGEIEVRSGLLFQKQILTGAPVHIGLGGRTAIDVARIVWPNGVMQAEFDFAADQAIVAEQRLKGSCPWVFAYDGHGMGFVTDFLWRSPLGLRINAQDTAGITQTEDWVKIRGDQLVPREGMYDIRITAELWESHFFDHVSLMAVDHPAGVDVFVDERFARHAPALAVQVMRTPQPVAGAWDDQAHDVTALVQARDGRHAAGFERGAYQGVAREHFLEIDLGADAGAMRDLWLVAYGWVYPTDSSLNVALAQGTHAAPHGVIVEAQDPAGSWRIISGDIGFPAGKNKTILIDLSNRPPGARRLRLRTNMEIYWDWLASAPKGADAALRTTRMAPASAELRYRGYSRTTEDRAAHAPETAHYDQLANTAPRWRDLVGYHTRFGDVAELLDTVDDRYVIMNAGDEMALAFRALPPPASGWTRDFVLIGDGWEKDGDFNTGYSKTVLPLPRHGHPDYVAASGSSELEDDPAYRRHPDDWQQYHTRFVAPGAYLQGLRPR